MSEVTSPSVPAARIDHQPGRHCASSAIRDLLAFHGVSLSEAMCFGLGAGLGITYLELPDAPVPFMVHVRSLGFEERVFRSIGVPFAWATFDTPDLATAALHDALDAGRPALLLTDIFHLPYFGSRTHFPGHAIVAWARSPETNTILVTDTERPDPVDVAGESMSQARFSNQLPFIHHGNMFAPHAILADPTTEQIANAIRYNAASLVAAVPNSGIPALRTWVNDLPRWEQTGDWRWTTRFAYQVIEKRGTGGGGFRRMYAEFLEEAARNDLRILQHGLPRLMRASEQQWSILASELKTASEGTRFPAALIADAINAVMTAEQNYADAAREY